MSGRAGLVAVMALTTVALSACSSDALPHQVWVTELKVNDCFNVSRDRELEAVSEVVLVDCGEPHDLQVYAKVPYPGEQRGGEKTPANGISDQEYPREKLVQAAAREDCAQRFRTYLGAADIRSDADMPSKRYALSYLYPSVESWTEAGRTRLELGLAGRLIDQPPAPERAAVCLVRSRVLKLRTPGANPTDRLTGPVRDAPPVTTGPSRSTSLTATPTAGPTTSPTNSPITTPSADPSPSRPASR
ncbi:septum formation family protein [Kineosporia sp. J2-2]|uniref:Septum formation family protein n=1 Tax=Kineosporia corallincola TaxID=2835133 RepID=A0ABS5TDE8_9ACTN|nr:septum formation family protein [Kineosporia corallincola]MBT0768221.1 septum formation family protein [Kineosporia corallincola]